jgi:hypothetical protein
MSDPASAPDPIDKAYAEAEALLSDEAARATRRARVIAAVASHGAPAAAALTRRPPLWRRSGWLVAASVTGFAFVIASQLYRPVPPPPPSKLAVVPATVAPPASPAPAPPTARPSKAVPRASKSAPERSSAIVAPSPSARAAPSAATSGSQSFPDGESAPPPPLPPDADAVASAAPPPAPPANRPDSATGEESNGEVVSEMIVTAEKRESRRQSVPAAVSAFTGRSRDVLDPGAQLRAAAAAGRTKEVAALLERGVSVDSPDADGDTALMKSIEADRPTTAGLLRRHGASLEQTNKAGESASDMARAKGDVKLDQAIGLGQ